MKLLYSLAVAATVVTLTACGGSSPKVVPVTPILKPAPVAKSTKDLHENIVLLAKYKKYQILKDNHENNLRIKYDRMQTDRKTKKVTLHSSITYDVKNSDKDYTFSYVDSTNLGYNEHNISSAYLRYVNMFDSTLKRMYKDPAYLERMKNIVAGLNPDGTPKAVK